VQLTCGGCCVACRRPGLCSGQLTSDGCHVACLVGWKVQPSYCNPSSQLALLLATQGNGNQCCMACYSCCCPAACHAASPCIATAVFPAAHRTQLNRQQLTDFNQLFHIFLFLNLVFRRLQKTFCGLKVRILSHPCWKALDRHEVKRINSTPSHEPPLFLLRPKFDPHAVMKRCHNVLCGGRISQDLALFGP
jgi:hypothetical protein